MYFTPVTILIGLVIALGWWLKRRDEIREAAEISRDDRQALAIIKQGQAQDIRSLENDSRSLGKDYARLKREHEKDREVLWKLLEQAEAYYTPYTTLDFEALALDPEFSEEDFNAVVTEAFDASAKYEFLARALNFKGSIQPLVVKPVWRTALLAKPVVGASECRHSWKATVAMEAAQQGVPAGPFEIHAAIDALVAVGQFTVKQGTALKDHEGILVGDAGASTIRKVVAAVLSGRLEVVSG